MNVHASKIAIFGASLLAGVLGVLWLSVCAMPDADDANSKLA